MRKLKYTLIIALAFLLAFSMVTYAEDFYDSVPDYSFGDMEELTGHTNFSDLILGITRGEAPKADNIIEKIINLIFADIRMCLKYTSAVLGFCILSSCVRGSQLSLKGNSGEIAYLACYFIVSGFLLGILQTAVKTALQASEELGAFIKMSLPAYIGILTATGINLKVGQSVFLAMVNIISSYAGGFMINAFLYIGILTVVSNMSEQIQISKLIGIFRQLMFWILGFLLTVFAGLTSLSGLNAAVSSGSGLRAIKYTVGRTVPLVGGFLADSAELIMASVRIFKGAFGTGGIIILCAICIVPLVKLFAVGFALKFTAGLAEPFCDKRMCDTVYQVGQTVIHIMVSLILMTVMFVLSFAVLLICGVSV